MTNGKSQEFRQLGLKVPAATYAELKRRGKTRGMAPTSLARWYVLDQLGHTKHFDCRKTGERRAVKPLTKEMKQRMALLRELQLIRMFLQQLQPKGKRTYRNLDDVARADLVQTLDLAKQVLLKTLDMKEGWTR